MSKGLFNIISMQSRRTQRFCHLVFCVILLVSLIAGPAPAMRALPILAASSVPISTRWIATAGMGTPRLGQTATLLTDGRVFVTGGVDANGQILATTEIYDPAMGVWSPAAPMRQARWHHTATMLRNGLVLVAGGSQIADPRDSSQTLDTAELYDPSANAWRPVRRMGVARAAHTATLLRDGMVLVVGGGGSGGPLGSAEIYNPTYSSWTPVGSMSDARWYHTATLLPGSDDTPSKVLVVGGRSAIGDTSFLASAEIYDSAAKTWSRAGTPTVPRDRHTATLLTDGTVLVVGGFNGAFLTNVERYDPIANSWTPVASLPIGSARRDHIATLLSNGRLLVAGGFDGTGYPTAALSYDSDARTWENAGALAGPGRAQSTATLLPDGRIFLAGGANGQAQSAAELYDPSVGSWSSATPLVISRRDHTATLLPDGTVLVAGGQMTSGEPTANGEIYGPASDTWTATGSLNSARFGHTATLLYNGKVLVAGGRDAATTLASAEIYDPAAKTWAATDPMKAARFGHTATLLANGKVLIAGGYDLATHSPLASAEIYDPATGHWTSTSSMSTPRSFFSATLLPDGSVLAAGGGDADGSTVHIAYNTAELYNWLSNTWTTVAQPMATPRWNHTATLLPSGKVLVAGGGDATGTPTSGAELFDPASASWFNTGQLVIAKRDHRATLLSDGRVLVMGGYVAGNTSAELYDPTTGAWTSTSALSAGRYGHTATFLPDGHVLVVGGQGSSGTLDAAEIFDAGLGFVESWRPVISGINDKDSKVPPDVGLYIAGKGFRGLSETSAGGVQGSPTNYPIVQLRSLANERMMYLTTNYNTSWSDTGVVSLAPYNAPSGYALATVVVNGIPSLSWVVKIGRDRYVARDDQASTDADNDCLRQNLPCHTIGAAVDQAYDGDRIMIGSDTYPSGTYPETLHLSKSLILWGRSTKATIIAGNGAPNTSVVSVTSGASVQLNQITIQGGNAQEGGGVKNEGNLSFTGVVSNSQAVRGGGIYNAGSLNFTGTISGNQATEGGGIYNIGVMNAGLSTISGNSATEGGGILQAGSDAASYLVLVNNTIANNTATSRGGGVAQRTGGINISNTILASNNGPAASPDCAGKLVSGGYNLLGNNAGCTMTAAEGDQIGTPEAPIDPLLGPLQDNGGLAPTHALLPSSPAIDAGSPALPGSGGGACYSYDLHGVTRPQGGRCDIGAYELVRPTRYAAPDGDDGNDCQTLTAPCRTISEAITKVPADGLVIAAAGTYTEAVSIDKNLSLVGAGAGATIINDDPLRLDNSVVAVVGGVTASSIFGVTIQNGVATPGGGIANSGALILDNVIVQSNRGGSNGGGGIYNYSSGTLAIRNHSRISGNHAAPNRGGGIYNEAGGRVTIEQSTISDNDAADNGGGIYNLGQLTLIGSTVSSNIASFSGGGIFSGDGSQTTIRDSAINANSANQGGGGLYNRGSMTIDSSPISGNHANQAAGIGNTGDLQIINSTIGGNSADGNAADKSGGGIRNSGTIVLIGATIRDNRAATRGGGIYSVGTATLSDTVIVSNTAGFGGGGIYIDEGGQAILEDVTVRDNQSLTTAGGIFVGNGATVQITGGGILSNTSAGQAGGVRIANNAVATLTDVVIDSNQSAAEAGGVLIGASTAPTATVAINHAIIQNNRAGGYGGGIESEGKLIITDTQIISNTTPSAGGGIDNIGELTITNSLISANRLENPTGDGISGGGREWGGGIWSRPGSKLLISGSTISGHLVGGDPHHSNGGGLNLSDATAVLTDVVISGNEVLGGGGGIYAQGTVLTIAGSTISGNRSRDAGPIGCELRNCNEGGGIFINSSGTLTITNSTVSSNHSDNIAGGIFWQGATSTSLSTLLDHVTISNNTAVDGGGIWRNGSEPIVHVRGSIIAGNTSISTTFLLSSDCEGFPISQGGNLFGIAGECSPTDNDLTGTVANPLDPRLGSLTDNGGQTPTHALLPGSPAIDAADDLTCPPIDQRGYHRPQGLHCDIGAYEATAEQTGTIFTVTTVTDSAAPCLPLSCSLRAAITAANAIPNGTAPNRISFSISGTGVHTIRPTSPLPAITDPVVIDGQSQPGFAGTPLIELDGSGAGTAANGLVLTGPSNAVQGLVINRFAGSGIVISGAAASGNVIKGNYIGVDAAGNTALANGSGILVERGAIGVVIGGSAPGAGNLISGNSQDGILIEDAADGTVVQGNLIGTSFDGAHPVANSGRGVTVDAASDTVIGGITPGEQNVVSGNHGAGVAILGDTVAHTRVRGNAIFGNDGLGIDLGGDGPNINDPGDTDSGPNGLLNSPTITKTIEGLSDTSFTGSLAGLPNTSFDVDLYVSPACNSSGQGDGLAYIGSVSAATDTTGAGTFSTTLPLTGLTGSWVTAVATTADGSSSEFSVCAPVATNDLWVNALPLDLTSGSASVSQDVTQTTQERWYRFTAQPGSQVRIRLTDQPGSVVTLHRDLQKVYDQLALPQSAASLSVGDLPGNYLPGNYLPGNYLPGNYLPGRYLPGSFLPGRYLPESYLPGRYLPTNYLPGSFLPGSSLPASSLPGRYLPGRYLPGRYLPANYLPGRYLPGRYLPGRYLPELYSGAIYRSLMAYSAVPDATEQVIERNTWDLSEDLYVRVAGPSNLVQTAPFSLTVEMTGGVCNNVNPVSSTIPETITGTLPATGQHDTLIVWDSTRFRAADPTGDINALTTRLAAFADRPDINGIVIDLAATEGGAAKYPRVIAANQQADRATSCAAAKNIVAGEIKNVIGQYRAANLLPSGTTSLHYIILVGGDDVVPFFRYPDNGGLANENEYYPPVEDRSAANAALRAGRVLGQDSYGATHEIWRGNYAMPLPDLAVGRLVGTAADVEGMLTAYESASGKVTPHSALVTGYDFIADAAQQVRDELTLGLNAPGCKDTPGGCVVPRSLIQLPGETKPWAADDLRPALLGTRNDLIFLNGHFDAGSLLAADYSTSMYASELQDAPANFTNTLVFGLGCHSGYNIPSTANLAGASPDPDWPHVFAHRGATFVAATGFAYGDTELTDFGERLMVGLSQQLISGTGPVPIGGALMHAKQQYLQQKGSLSGLDDKTLLQFVLYGLPMLQVDMPGDPVTVPDDPSIVSGATPVIAGPGNMFGLQVGQPVGATAQDPAAEVIAQPTLKRVDLPLTNVATNTRITASYFTGPSGTVANPSEPVQPLARYTANVDGLILRGIGFRGGTYTDLANIVPRTSSPTTEQPRAIGGFTTPTFYPTQAWGTNYFGALVGGSTRLMVVPGQYRSNDSTSSAGTLRNYSDMRFRLYYLDARWADQSDKQRRAAILGPAPEIASVEAQDLGGGRAEVHVGLINKGAAGVQEVWVTWTDLAAPGQWRSIDLQPTTDDQTTWQTPAGGVALPATAVFMVQVATGTGLVTLSTNNGAYYAVVPSVPPPPPPPPPATALDPVAIPSSVTFGQTSTFSARLMAGTTPLAEKQALLILGAQQLTATSDSTGLLRFNLALAQSPGDYPGRIVFAGDSDEAGSALDFNITLAKDQSRLLLSPAIVATAIGQPTKLVASLSDSTNLPVADRTVVFVASGPSGTFARAVKTGLAGQAVLGVVAWPAGSYSVRAYFSGSIPLPGGAVGVEDQFYDSSASDSAQLSITAGVPETTIISGPPSSIDRTSATFTFGGSDDLTPSDGLRFECALDGAAFAPCSSPTSYSGLAVGQHLFLVRAIDGNDFVDPTPASWAWTVSQVAFPQTSLLDDFNRHAGRLGSHWTGSRDGYRIRRRQLRVTDGGPLYWADAAFSADQEVYVTLVRGGRDEQARSEALLLKVQGSSPNWRKGAIMVRYSAKAWAVHVQVYQPGHPGWKRYPSLPVAFQEGDQIGARALSNGNVQIFINGRLAGEVTLNAANQAFFNSRGGWIGLWSNDEDAARLDNFGGGSLR